MIVSNFTPGSAGALQGVDLLARATKAPQQDGGTSSFSDFLGASDRVDAPVPAVREARLPARTGAPVTARENSFENSTGAEATQTLTQALGDTGGSAGSAAPAGLDDAPPLFRDPRLDDPAELALEAAAIALAAALMQKPQVALPLPLVVDESQPEGGLQQGGSQAQPDGQANGAEAPLPASVSLPSVLPVSGGTQPALSAVTAAPVPSAQKTQTVRVVLPRTQSPEQLQQAAVTLGENPAAAAAVAPSIVPSIVLTAKPDQAVALAAAGAGLPFSQHLESLPVSVGTAVLAQAVPAEANQTSSQLAGELFQSSLNPLQPTESSRSEGNSDAEFLASALPVDPAAAFFAAQASQQQTPAKSGTTLADTAAGELESESASAELEVGLDTKPEDLGLLRKEMQGSAAEGHSKQIKTPVSWGNRADTSVLKTSAEADSEVGTFGAEEGDVQREASSVLARSEESSTPITVEGEALTSVVSPAADNLGATASQSGTGARSVHQTASRPAVLPPVQAKASELFNVVQNALERARSENPSHLAVEITLDDGSSFGLEVRMSASGLQASFRSESQPLLKVLENQWAGFLARESADSKVVSAAFEGRSGFGEFSNNGSTAGERRQQFEDSASAAFLANENSDGVASGKPQAEAVRKDLGATGGMALYA